MSRSRLWRVRVWLWRPAIRHGEVWLERGENMWNQAEVTIRRIGDTNSEGDVWRREWRKEIRRSPLDLKNPVPTNTIYHIYRPRKIKSQGDEASDYMEAQNGEGGKTISIGPKNLVPTNTICYIYRPNTFTDHILMKIKSKVQLFQHIYQENTKYKNMAEITSRKNRKSCRNINNSKKNNIVRWKTVLRVFPALSGIPSY